MKKPFLASLLFLLLASLTGYRLSAQTTQASIIGVITDESKKPVSGATVQLYNESTGFTTATLTNAKGEYIFKELPLGGPYTIKATFVGYGEQKRTDYSLNQGDLLRVNISMQVSAASMNEVTVTATGQRKKTENFGAATSVTARDISRLPVNGRNFTSLIDLSPLSSGNNLAGQLGSSTNITIDGTSAKNPTSSSGTNSRIGGPYAISMEAIREFKVVTNQYDVTYGRSGGGTISTVTKSGTNNFSGSAFMFSRADWLSSKYDIRGARRVNDFSTYQYGFSLGGPIIKNKAHFFIAWDRQDDARPLQLADIKSAADEKRLNVTQTSLDRYLEIARGKYGVSNEPQFGSFNKRRNTDAAFLRVDWQLNEKNLLTIRNNYVNDRAPLGRDDNSSINLYEVYADANAWNNSLMATLRTVVNSRLTNELKLQHLYTFEESTPGDQLPKQNIPRGIVERVQSTIDGASAFTTIQLGGQRYSPEHFYNNVFQLVNNVYFNTNKFNYTFGTDIQYTHMNSLYGSEMNGRFYFTGLTNFDNQTPYRYAREVALEDDPSVDQNVLNAALYGQMKTQLFPGFELTAGIRADYTNYFNKPNFNQVVFDDLGLTTNRSLNTFQLQPRIQFNWDINERHRDYLRLGAGVFGSDINNYAMINNMVFDGTKVLSVDIQGAGIPTPNFPGYRNNPSTAPGKELFDQGIPRLATINMNGKDARIPVVYKANISYSRFITDRLKVGVTFFTTLARNNYMYVDRNMVDDPYFRLANEGNRGVYVPANTINTTNGATDWMRGRKSNRIGRILELTSEGKVNQYAFVVDGTWRYFKDGEVSFSYTWNDSKDNTSYNGDVANTATLSLMVNDDPRNLSKMSYSDNQFRHKAVFYGTLPTFYGVSVGVRYSGIGGTRYSLAVNGNVNGDFVNSNDLAYVFDVNDPKVAEKYRTGLTTILNNPGANKSIKKYLEKSNGNIAERNGGINRFNGVWDVRVAKKFNVWKKQYIELSGDIFNVENLINKSWGATKNLGKQNIYSLGGFDPVTSSYNYNVNLNAGVITPSGNPWQIQVGVRYGF
ncbi:TonB-dependent receptor [Niastella caeni]|uniref:TonB-dependent receptor n=1 Tax=Niastella caeni TaxID=2569763 RepID=A0A4S8HIU7_9BACT|nr:carboxypeptidase regulatory-like domain-containing protein [Niastella caeni]THU34189.1 TonB-dependent receptor [Niastella caeni]